MPLLQKIKIYPVKAASAIDLSECSVERRGLAGDRRWMIVDQQFNFLSQRMEPLLSILRVRVEEDIILLAAEDRGQLIVIRPGIHRNRIRVRIWGDDVEAIDAGEDVAVWISGFVGRLCRLVYMPDDSIRKVDARYGEEKDRVSFADGYPVLLVSQASLDDLNSRLSKSIGIDRFRPNLVITGARPFEEDRWQKIAVGDVLFRVAKPCARCNVINVDQATGRTDKEPLHTLSTFRSNNGKVYFGQNLIPETTGYIRVHDRITVIA